MRKPVNCAACAKPHPQKTVARIDLSMPRAMATPDEMYPLAIPVIEVPVCDDRCAEAYKKWVRIREVQRCFRHWADRSMGTPTSPEIPPTPDQS